MQDVEVRDTIYNVIKTTGDGGSECFMRIGFRLSPKRDGEPKPDARPVLTVIEGEV